EAIADGGLRCIVLEQDRDVFRQVPAVFRVNQNAGDLARILHLRQLADRLVVGDADDQGMRVFPQAHARGPESTAWTDTPGQPDDVSILHARRNRYDPNADRSREKDPAMSAGWSDAAAAARDPDLAPLHHEPDFRALLGELFDRAFPAHPFVQ